MTIRNADPSDHARVAAVIDAWWGGRRMRDMLPRLFFTHFRETSSSTGRTAICTASFHAHGKCFSASPPLAPVQIASSAARCASSPRAST